jgi:hypothetical protein
VSDDLARGERNLVDFDDHERILMANLILGLHENEAMCSVKVCVGR